MLVLRCTRKLLDRIGPQALGQEGRSTTRLSDWYATILLTRPAHLVLLVNETSRLPVVLPAREISTLLSRIPGAVGKVLLDIGIPERAVNDEQAAMGTIVCAPTRNRSVVGTINDFVFQLDWRRQRDPALGCHALSLELAETPVGPLHDEYPIDVARRILASPTQVPQ